MSENNKPLLQIQNLSVEYRTDEGVVAAVSSVDLDIFTGKTLGLVGETGAGKTTLARSIMGLIPKPPGEIISGSIVYDDKDLITVDDTTMRSIRGAHISMIFQDPMTSLNPVMTVGDQIMEVILQHNKGISKEDANKKVCEMLELVDIVSSRAGDYPHQFSGGMKQRVIIAIALACNPKLLIADEPTTALDVTIQAQVLETIRDLKAKTNTSMLLITHDLGVVAQNCDDVAIIYAGEIVEIGTVREVFKNPTHPYTIGLFGSIPNLTVNVKRLTPVDGLMPDPTNLPEGCKFHPRCPRATEECKVAIPEIISLEGTHKVRCIHSKANKTAGGES